jgi:hypothetical protein
MQQRTEPKIDFEINPQGGGKAALVISLIALIFSP